MTVTLPSDWPLKLDLSRDEGFAVPPGLDRVHSPKVIWAKEHSSVPHAWLSIRALGPAMLLQWRPGPHYGYEPVDVGVVCDGLDANANLQEAIKEAEELLALPEVPAVLMTRIGKRSEKNAAKGIKSGEKRAQAKAAKLADADPNKPQFNRKTWRWEPFIAMDCQAWILRRLPNTDTGIVAYDAAGDGAWSVYRVFYPGGNADADQVTDILGTNLEWPEVVRWVNWMALTNPRDWSKGNAQALVQRLTEGEQT